MLAKLIGRILMLTITLILAAWLLTTSNPRAATKPNQTLSSESESLLAGQQKTVSHIKPLSQIPYRFLAKVADKAIQKGHIYSSRWGDASPWLRALTREMVERRFSEFGTARWALYVVNRESGFNPGAINSTSGTTGIAQIHPDYHRWIDYYRVKHDMRYALSTFARLSRGGHNTGPWCLC